MILSAPMHHLHTRALEAISGMHHAILSSESVFSIAIKNALLGLPAEIPVQLLENHPLLHYLNDREYELFQEDRILLTQIYNWIYEEFTRDHLPSIDAYLQGDRSRIRQVITKHGMVLLSVEERLNHV